MDKSTLQRRQGKALRCSDSKPGEPGINPKSANPGSEVDASPTKVAE